jgi:hypothetical protein
MIESLAELVTTIEAINTIRTRQTVTNLIYAP